MFFVLKLYLNISKKALAIVKFQKHLHLFCDSADRNTVYTKQWALKQTLSAFMLFEINKGKQRLTK